ncbi:MAG TPA: hypothetical protein VD887_05305 [Allosphingosinicella sp.]|nr:hypothetical protein [Allosphingosinicella sp.]
MPAVSRRVERIRVTLECLSYVTVIAGIFLFFVQQREVENARRVETALLFVSLENDEAYTRARETLTAPWQRVDMSRIMAARPSRDTIHRLKLEVTRDVPDASIENVYEFYSSVVGCRDHGLCDRTIIDQFFRRGVSGFYCTYDVRLAQIGRRLNRPDYGRDLQSYAGSCT